MLRWGLLQLLWVEFPLTVVDLYSVRPGTKCAIGLFGTALAMDAVLVAAGQDTISTCVRTGRYEKAFAVYLTLHAAVNLPVDPLCLLGAAYTNAYTARRANGGLTLRLPNPAIAPKIRLRLPRLPRGERGGEVR